ncbi:MAG: hypothetical protein IRZ07_20070 [Microbispora sp.]|nr:hypothetical protein [Microbispora sp.]
MTHHEDALRRVLQAEGRRIDAELDQKVGVPGWTPGTPRPTAAKEPKDMSTIQKHPLELEPGDVITGHPHTSSPVRLRVTAPPVRFGDTVEIDYSERGRRGVLVVDQHDTVTVHTTHRQDVITGLRALADRLEAEPHLPVDRWPTLQYSVSRGRCPQDAVREVDRVAGLLGVKARWRGTDYLVEYDLGPVRYVAVALDAAEVAS